MSLDPFFYNQFIMKTLRVYGVEVKCPTGWLLRVLSLLWLLAGWSHGQVITASIDSVSGPGGTPASPTYVIDSDAANGTLGYTRDQLSVSASVTFVKNTTNFSEAKDFRLSAQLIDVASNTAVTLESGTTSQAGSSLNVELNAFFPFATQTLTTMVDPGVDLGAGKSYLLRVTVQRLDTFLFNGFPLQVWVAADGPDDSSGFTVVHFMDGAGGADRFVRGYATGGATWTRSYLMATDPAKDVFTATLPYFMSRYDVGGSSAAVSYQITATLTDDMGTNVPLAGGGVTSTTLSLAAGTIGIPYRPTTASGTFTASFAPVAQLDSRNRTYQLHLEVKHLEVTFPMAYRTDATTPETALTRLLHFNGRLLFGALPTQIDSLQNNPVSGTLGVGYVNTLVQVAAGSIPSQPAYSYGSGAALGVRLMVNGDAVVTSGSEPVAGAVSAMFSRIKVDYPGTVLSATGPSAGAVKINLPQGLGYTPDRAAAAMRYEPTFAVGGSRPLTVAFRHTGTLSSGVGPAAWVFDESRPLLYQVTGFAFTQAGEIQFDTVDAEWAHAEAFDEMEANEAAGRHAVRTMAYRLSNDGYLRFARIDTPRKVAFNAAADSSVRALSAVVDIAPGYFRTHFPLDTEVVWSGPGALKLSDGAAEAGSLLTGAKEVKLSFDGSCPDDPCGPAAGALDSITSLSDSGKFQITPDGGLFATSGFDPHVVKWGIKGDGMGGAGPYTHRTDNFRAGDLFVPGYQIYESSNPLGTGAFAQNAAELAPGLVLLSGYDSAAPHAMVYPETSEYRRGDGAYAGLTMAVEAGNRAGASRIADMVADYTYSLQPAVSKYYVRASGISGRHVAEAGSFDPDVVLYGYHFKLTMFQLTFLSDENKASWIRGTVTVTGAANFSQRFNDLLLSCTGALESAEVDPTDTGDKALTYWNGSFNPVTMRFAPQTGGGCYGDRFLTIGLITGAANIPTPLAGSLAFMPSGNIGTLADHIEGVDCRLGLPATIAMDGPGDEQYALCPVNKLYFNNPEASGAPASGFVSFAATCGVPFFQDLKVHCMTSAQADVPASLFLASGWDDGTDTFFTNQNFDAAHRGFPPTGTVADYQSPSAVSGYVVHAVQSIFGLVALDYPLQWNATSRYFTSWGPETDNLLVLSVEHQVDYLSADNAEISFGAQYQGLPQINLVSTAYDAVDEQLGAARALTDAASQFVTDTLNDGVGEIGDLVSDNLELVLDEALNSIEGEVIDPLYQAVVDSYSGAAAANETYGDWVDGSTGDLKLVFDRYLDGSFGAAANSINGRLDALASATAGAVNLVSRVDAALARGILAIDSVTGELQTYRNSSGNVVVDLTPPAGYSPDGVINGILKKVAGGGGEPERQIVQALVRALIAELAPADLALVLEPLLLDLSSELNDQLNELLTKFDPTLERVTEALLEARAYLVGLRTKLAPGQELLTNFQQIIATAAAEIDAIVNEIRSAAYSFIDRIADGANYLPGTVLGAAGNLVGEFDKEEFIALIRAELRDRLLSSNFVQQIQYTLRQYISEFEMAMKSAIDSAFGEVSRMCKELIKEALGPLDESINNLLGGVDKYVGAGSVDGYAHIQGDTLRKLRLDAEVQLKVPDEMKLQAYFEMNCYDSSSATGGGACTEAGEEVVEVKIGALDVPLDWVSPDLRADLEVRFSMQTAPTVEPKGIGGSLKMTSGELNFQGMKITAFAAGVGVGSDECYLAATARVIVSNYEAAGGIFFGRTCSIEPLELVDPEVAALLGAAPFTGAYVYGEVWIPISEVVLGIPASCLFRISAGVGAGAFYFAEGPTYGGKMMLGVSGEALCVVSIRGEVSMIGVMSDGSLRFKGTGRLSGKAGACPFCVKFKKSATITYQDGDWSVDF